MIPKKIHYCWFGKNKKSDLINYCIQSWEKHLYEYDIIEWNESNFDINSNVYVKEAYENGKYAFVSDYVRLYVLYNYGGIYLDTDVEVIKSLDSFLIYDAFTGYEDKYWAVTGTMGSVKYNEIIMKLLETYKERHFIINGRMDLSTNTKMITNFFIKEYELTPNGETTVLGGTNFKIFPMDYFCAKNWETKELYISENTYTIHHFNASWHKK